MAAMAILMPMSGVLLLLFTLEPRNHNPPAALLSSHKNTVPPAALTLGPNNCFSADPFPDFLSAVNAGSS